MTEIVGARMGKPGTPEREVWVARCVLRDLEACAEHPDLPTEAAKGYFRDGAEALRRMIALADPPKTVGMG